MRKVRIMVMRGAIGTDFLKSEIEDESRDNAVKEKMNLHVKRFEELSVQELYHIMKLRVDVFVVEQKCPYMELDNRDQDSLHVWYEEDGVLQAYLRIMDKGIESEFVSIGRVIAAKRNCGMGNRILSEGIRTAKAQLGADKIYLEAQVYAKPFYEKHGFRQISDEFLEDGIPHVKMLLDCTSEKTMEAR